jgi:hypothetical protein
MRHVATKRNLRAAKERSKPKPTVKAGGIVFERYIENFFNMYLEENNIDGRAYLFSMSPDVTQQIDILVDSQHMGCCGIECKSIFEDDLENGKILFENITHTSKSGLNQLVRQHQFLEDTGRYGMIAFEFRCMCRVYLVPHNYVYDKYTSGSKFIRVNDVIRNGFDINERGCLVSFIRNKCW